MADKLTLEVQAKLGEHTLTAFDKAWPDYDSKRSEGLLSLLMAVSGREAIAVYGEEPDNYADPRRSGTYIVEFEGGVAIRCDYRPGEAGYSEYTPGYPASVEYDILTRKD